MLIWDEMTETSYPTHSEQMLSTQCHNTKHWESGFLILVVSSFPQGHWAALNSAESLYHMILGSELGLTEENRWPPPE